VGPWTLTIGGAVEDAGVEIAFTGSLTFQVAEDLSATYTIDIGATATNLPPQLVGLLDFSGGGNARFVDDPQSPASSSSTGSWPWPAACGDRAYRWRAGAVARPAPPPSRSSARACAG